MREITAASAAAYLRELGWIDAREPVEVRELTGGVSNCVLYVHRTSRPGDDFVLKQAREQLRVPDAWFCSVERIWREVDVLELCQRILRESQHASPANIGTPAVLRVDRDNYAFAMTAAASDHRVWKSDLLAGRIDPAIASACGWLLGRLHAATWNDADAAERLGDAALFDALRLDPYYRTVARAHPESAAFFESLCAGTRAHRLALVHADFSPKNLLVFEGGLMMLDFETGHFGDPAFDLGFFLTHLCLKALHRPAQCDEYLALADRFWEAHAAQLQDTVSDAEYTALESRGMAHLAGCLWARVDGKSRVEYLDEPTRDAVRVLCRQLVADRPAVWSEFRSKLRRMERL